MWTIRYTKKGSVFSIVYTAYGIRNRNKNDSIYIFQESYNTPLEHTSGNPPSQLWKESLYSLLVRFRGVFQRCVETTLDI